MTAYDCRLEIEKFKYQIEMRKNINDHRLTIE
jgi:hypothetical protein